MADASQLWRTGNREGALAAMRAAVLVSGGSPGVWRAYAQRLVEVGRPDAAWEAIQTSLTGDSGSPDAIELLVELSYHRTGSFRGVRRAVETMAAGIAERPQYHREALDFLIPFGIETGLDEIAAGPDGVARAVVALHRGDTSLLTGMPDVDRLEALVRFSLARGRVSVAAKHLRDLPDSHVPVAAVRRAVRRVMKKEDPSGAAHLLKHYRRVRPDDVWAIDREKELLKYARATPETVARAQLTQEGYPFSEAGRITVPARSRRGLYLLHNSLPFASAGYATRTHGLLRALNGMQWQIDGVTRPGFPFDLSSSSITGPISGEEVIDGVRYVRLSTSSERPRKSPLTNYIDDYVARLGPVASQVDPFVIHAASNHWNGLAAVEAGRRLGLPSVYEIRGLWEVTRLSREPEFEGSDQHLYMSRMEAEAAKHATHVFAITRALRDEMISRGVDESKITLLPNGVDTARFVPRERDVELAESLGVVGKTVVGYVGSVLDYEGIDLLIEATALLRAQRTDFHVLVVGDGAALGAVQQRAEALRLQDVLTFTGRVPHEDVERYYSLIDIAPLPRQPLPVCEMVSPLKPFEAMAMGKVVVASDVAALAEIVHDGQTGLLHRKGDVESLALQIGRLIDEPELLARLGAAAREWVVRERDWSVIANRISDVYEDILRRVPSR